MLTAAFLGYNAVPRVLGQGQEPEWTPGPTLLNGHVPGRAQASGRDYLCAAQRSGLGRASFLYRSVQSRYSCWRPSSYGLAPSYGLALRAAFGRTVLSVGMGGRPVFTLLAPPCTG